MRNEKMIITSESVTEGHPDKICDNISDAILDAMLEKDPESRCAVETAIKNGLVLLIGEVRTTTYVDFQKITRDTLKRIGYTNPKFGIDYEDCAVLASVQEQSPDIAQGVDGSEEEQGAGDQGMMYGYASDETEELMPLPITLAHQLTKKLAEVRKSGAIPLLGPDGKSQVSVEYDKAGKPQRVTAVVIAQQHLEELDENTLRKEIRAKVVDPIVGKWTDADTAYHINATGKFVIGGPEGDAGLTGRKIIVDTYGGVGRHGGGAFSGKDSSKVDRSGAYAARWVAKNVVAAGLAKKCEVQLSYAIGVAKPTSINVDTFGTNTVDEEKISEAILKVFDLRPGIIVKALGLKKPIFSATAAYGHFGRKEFPWESVAKAAELKNAVN